MADITPYLLVKQTDLKLDISCLKTKKGHENEALFSCKIKYKNKHIANYEDLDWGNSDFADITVVNQELYDEAINQLKAIAPYNNKATNKMVNVDMLDWAHSTCIYKDIEKQAKREKQLAYFNETDQSIRVFSKSKEHTVEAIQEHMKSMNNIVPFHDLKQEDVTNYYLKEFKIAV